MKLIPGTTGGIRMYLWLSNSIFRIYFPHDLILDESGLIPAQLVFNLIGSFRGLDNKGRGAPSTVVNRYRGHKVSLSRKTNHFPFSAHFIILPYSQIFDDLDGTWPDLIEAG